MPHDAPDAELLPGGRVRFRGRILQESDFRSEGAKTSFRELLAFLQAIQPLREQCKEAKEEIEAEFGLAESVAGPVDETEGFAGGSRGSGLVH